MSWWLLQGRNPASRRSLSSSSSFCLTSLYQHQSMASNYILPLKAPTALPASGVDIVTFKVWRNTLIAHVQQDTNHHYFMSDGLYSEWQSAESGSRIAQIHEDDPDKIAADAKYDRIGEQAYNVLISGILKTRNAQLSKFITHIATLCHHTENDDVTNLSTSLEWIFDYLKRHYGLQTKGANFLNISEHVYKAGTPYQTFYKQYRASFLDNLRKRGDYVKFKNDHLLTEDEKLSPSFENAIIMWALEKIDARLPAKVKKNYGHQMTGNTTLMDIQPVVFENIPGMLEELEYAQATKSFSAQIIGDQSELNSIQFRNKNRRNSSRQMPTRPKPLRTNSRYFTPRNKQDRTNVTSTKFCRICHLAGSESQVYNSHEIGNCSRLTVRDMESLRDALILNGMVTLDIEEPRQPEYFLQPGWDDAEASGQKDSDESE